MEKYFKVTNAAYRNLLHIRPEKSPLDSQFSFPFLSISEMISDQFVWVKMSVWKGPIQSWRVNTMSIDTDGQLHGSVTLEVFEGKSGSIPGLDWSPKIIMGTFVHGKLNGIVMFMTYRNQAVFATIKDNVFHGPCYVMGNTAILSDMEERGFSRSGTENFYPGTGFVGRFKNGKIHGDFWLGMLQGAYLHGKVSENGYITGDDIAYIYPDGVTAFKGRFENKLMIKAYNVDVQEYGCNEDGILVVKSYTEPLSSQVFKYEPCTNISFGGGAPPSVRDPYEIKTVKLATSTQPQSGEGTVFKNHSKSLISISTLLRAKRAFKF